ncbi:MAG: DUF3368 domain-containing protein [Planctomycetes bacterium]|nr:DUF3368 domain-containing protein [Planctomycetota bacterium]
MPEPRELVINTGPLIALTAALGDLKLLSVLYQRVIVPLEVCDEILVQNATRYGAAEFHAASWLEKRSAATAISPFLRNVLDLGEAAVIQVAANERVGTVCIDEPVGRRIARLHGLRVTGTLGVLIRGKREGQPIELRRAIERMQGKGVRLSERVIRDALKEAGEL